VIPMKIGNEQTDGNLAVTKYRKWIIIKTECHNDEKYYNGIR